MKATLNILKVTALGLTILFGTQSAFAQKGESTSPKDVIKTEQSGKDKIKTGETTEGTQTGGKDDLKNGSTSGKDDLKNGNTSGKDDIKNGTEETEGTEGSVEGSHEGHAHEGGGNGNSDAGTTDGGAKLGSVSADGVYARDKSLEGKPYDQARLDAAKSKANAVIAAAESRISSEEAHLQAAREKIAAAEQAVIEMKSAKKPDEAAIATKEAAIGVANEKFAALEQQITSAKAAIATLKARLTPATASK